MAEIVKMERNIIDDMDVIGYFTGMQRVRDFMEFVVRETYEFTQKHKETNERYAPLVWWNPKGKSISFQSNWMDRCIIEYITNYRYIGNEFTNSIVVNMFKETSKDKQKIIRRIIYVMLFGDCLHITAKSFRGSLTTRNLHLHYHLLKYKDKYVEYNNIPFYKEHLMELLASGHYAEEMEKILAKLIDEAMTYDYEFEQFGHKNCSNYMRENRIIPIIPFRISLD